jgi:hypothetical protein
VPAGAIFRVADRARIAHGSGVIPTTETAAA